MPRCKKCGALIHSGRHCPTHAKEEKTVDAVDRPKGPDYVECENCDGRSWNWRDGEKTDCEVCDGFGKVRVDRELVADGGEIIDGDRDEPEIVVAEDGGEIIDE